LLQDAVERLESKEKIEKKLDREELQTRLICLIHSSFVDPDPDLVDL
jgi:hypothetical protein